MPTLLDIDTGHEGKFDFPWREAPPEILYLLAGVPRTGSSHLSHLLWQTGCLGAPLEYLNFDEMGPYGFASNAPDLQQTLWQSVLHRRVSPNGVFGFKCFPPQLQAFHATSPATVTGLLTALRPDRIVYLGRRDRVAHVVSYARATLSGIWRREQEGEQGAEVGYSEEMLATIEQWIDLQQSIWEKMFEDLRIAPLRLWHEDVVADPGAAVRQVAAHLGVTLVPEAAIAVPAVLKQAEADSRAWIERYARSRAAGAS